MSSQTKHKGSNQAVTVQLLKIMSKPKFKQLLHRQKGEPPTTRQHAQENKTEQQSTNKPSAPPTKWYRRPCKIINYRNW